MKYMCVESQPFTKKKKMMKSIRNYIITTMLYWTDVDIIGKKSFTFSVSIHI